MNANFFTKMFLTTAAFLALTAAAAAYEFVPGSGGINANPYANAARRAAPRYAPTYVMPAPRAVPMTATPRVVVPAIPAVPAPVVATPAAPTAPRVNPEVCVHCGN